VLIIDQRPADKYLDAQKSPSHKKSTQPPLTPTTHEGCSAQPLPSPHTLVLCQLAA
jgi:hypothetical protein